MDEDRLPLQVVAWFEWITAFKFHKQIPRLFVHLSWQADLQFDIEVAHSSVALADTLAANPQTFPAADAARDRQAHGPIGSGHIDFCAEGCFTDRDRQLQFQIRAAPREESVRLDLDDQQEVTRRRPASTRRALTAESDL
jgi:hypothetical protein